MATSTITIKATLGDDTRRLSVAESVLDSFETLRTLLTNRFQLTQPLAIKWIDEDMDEITLASDRDLAEIDRSSGKLRLMLSVAQDANSAPPAPEPPVEAGSAAPDLSSLFSHLHQHTGPFFQQVQAGHAQMPPFVAQMQAAAQQFRANYEANRPEREAQLKELGEKLKAELEPQAKEIGEQLQPFLARMQRFATKMQKAAEEAAPAVHWGVSCDASGEQPIVGVRWHRKGEDYDLNDREYQKLDEEQRQGFERIDVPRQCEYPGSPAPPEEVAQALMQMRAMSEAAATALADTMAEEPAPENAPEDAPAPEAEQPAPEEEVQPEPEKTLGEPQACESLSAAMEQMGASEGSLSDSIMDEIQHTLMQNSEAAARVAAEAAEKVAAAEEQARVAAEAEEAARVAAEAVEAARVAAEAEEAARVAAEAEEAARVAAEAEEAARVAAEAEEAAAQATEVEDPVALLMEMGFSEMAVTEALQVTQGSVDNAAEWLFVHQPEECQEFPPAPVAETAAFPAEWDGLLRDLLEMGFEEKVSKEALARNDGDVKTAVRELVQLERAA